MDIKKVAEQVEWLNGEIAQVGKWKHRYLVRAIIIKALFDRNYKCTVTDIERALQQVFEKDE